MRRRRYRDRVSFDDIDDMIVDPRNSFGFAPNKREPQYTHHHSTQHVIVESARDYQVRKHLERENSENLFFYLASCFCIACSFGLFFLGSIFYGLLIFAVGIFFIWIGTKKSKKTQRLEREQALSY